MTKPQLWMLVQRDQCNGRSLSCVNCGALLDEFHNILCHARQTAYRASRGGGRPSSAPTSTSQPGPTVSSTTDAQPSDPLGPETEG